MVAVCKPSSRNYSQICSGDLSDNFVIAGVQVIYSCFAAAHDRNILNNRNHMIAGFEQCIRAMPQHVEQWVWVSDFQGFGLSDCDPRLAKIFLDISAWHYPERCAS